MIVLFLSCVQLKVKLKPAKERLENTHVKVMKYFDPSYQTDEDRIEAAKKDLANAYSELAREVELGLTALTQLKAVKLAEDCQHHLFRLKTGRIDRDLKVMPIRLSEDIQTRYGIKYLAEIESECRELSWKVNSINALGCYLHEIKVDIPISEETGLGEPYYYYPTEDCASSFSTAFDHSYLFSSPKYSVIPCLDVPERDHILEDTPELQNKLKNDLCKDGVIGYTPDKLNNEYKGCKGWSKTATVFCFAWVGNTDPYGNKNPD